MCTADKYTMEIKRQTLHGDETKKKKEREIKDY
jgi:hypothetical protein